MCGIQISKYVSNTRFDLFSLFADFLFPFLFIFFFSFPSFSFIFFSFRSPRSFPSFNIKQEKTSKELGLMFVEGWLSLPAHLVLPPSLNNCARNRQYPLPFPSPLVTSPSLYHSPPFLLPFSSTILWFSLKTPNEICYFIEEKRSFSFLAGGMALYRGIFLRIIY